MTYCLALRLDEGLLFLADTRTNADVVDAGSLATTQQVLDRVDRDLEATGDHESLATVGHLFEAALYLGRISRDVAQSHHDALGTDATATFVLGGQITGERPDIILVYPEGNYIRASDERPFLQIGESKYGKFMLELAVQAHVDLITAGKIALTSMVSTAHANLSVGPPYDVAIYRNGTMAIDELRITADSAYLAELQAVWARHLFEAIADLPPVPPGAFSS